MTVKTVALALLSAVILAVPAGAQDETTTQDQPMYLGTEPLESCVSRWDPGTNMTKEEWRESCKRISEERGTYLKKHGGVPEGE